MSGQDMKAVQVAHELRVSTKSAYQWRRRWRAGGKTALASKGAGGAASRLGPAQLARLRAALDQGGRPGLGGGPAVDAGAGHHLDRAAVHVRYTLRGTSYLLHRMGYTPQVPVHRAAERDEAAIATWRDVTWSSFGASSGDRGVFVLRGRE